MDVSIDIETECEVPVERLEANIRLNAGRELPFLLDQKYETRKEPLAIVGGGPSLRYTLRELREFKYVMVCGTAHDHVIEEGILPDYAVICDQAPWLDYLKLNTHYTEYLLATQVDPLVVDHLKDSRRLFWDMDGWVDEAVFDGRPRINGGTTAAMRAPSLGLVLGFSEFHFFGVDSSFGGARHAYAYRDEDEGVITAKINRKSFRTTLPYLAQAKDFQTLLTNFGHLFSVEVHGDSLLYDVWRDMRTKTDRIINRENCNV